MPKIRGRSLAEHRAETRSALFHALTTLIRERGFDAVTLAEVAQRAEVGRTAIYNYFPDKESMLLDFIEEETGKHLAGMVEAINVLDDPLAQLRCYGHGLLLMSSNEFHLLPGAALRDVLSDAARARLREHVRPVEGVLRTMLARGCATGVFPAQNIDVTVALINSAVTGRTLPQDDAERAVYVEAILTFVLRGVGVRPSA